MTGPEHYLEAERLMSALDGVPRGDDPEVSIAAEAQVHATLAVAAAIALNGRHPDGNEWREAAGTRLDGG